jgi:hypothetical protein
MRRMTIARLAARVGNSAFAFFIRIYCVMLAGGNITM